MQAVNGALRKVPAWPLYPLAAIPPAVLFWLALQGRLGADPVEAMEHRMGLWGLWALLAVLAISPLRRFANLNLLKFRRALGLIGFFYIFLHMLLWVLDVQIPAALWADVVKRPYITIGMAALVLMLPLALTSNDWSVRRLGPRWRSLHRATYAAVLLGAVHFALLTKTWQLEPILYVLATVALLAVRKLPRRRGMVAARA
ncbi:MAG: protein-methionine-sulfoxide reductase heme-binding subunit MsrQ [Shimia sp.]